MMNYTTRNSNNQLRYRSVDSLIAPHLHVEGEHKLNFINETVEMLASTSPILQDRHRIILERTLARRSRTSPNWSDPHAVVISDNQWRSWRDIRGLFLAMRYAHERRAALPRITSPAPAGPLSIPLPGAAA